MNQYQELYKKKQMSAEQALELIQDGDSMFSAQAAAEPQAILSKLQHLKETGVKGTTLNSCLPIQYYDAMKDPEMAGIMSHNGWFFTAGLRDAQKKIFRLCMGFTAVMFVLARAAGPLFVRLFTKDAQVAEISAWAIRVCTLAAIPLGAQYEIVDGFTALGQVRLSFPLSFFRKAVYFALFILPACFGARAAFYAEPVSDVLGPLASAIAYKLCIGPVLSDGHARV